MRKRSSCRALARGARQPARTYCARNARPACRTMAVFAARDAHCRWRVRGVRRQVRCRQCRCRCRCRRHCAGTASPVRRRSTRRFASPTTPSPPDSFVLALKFRGRLALAGCLAALLAERVHSTRIALPDVIAPIPLSSRRLVERGYNPGLGNRASVRAPHTPPRHGAPADPHARHRSRRPNCRARSAREYAPCLRGRAAGRGTRPARRHRRRRDDLGRDPRRRRACLEIRGGRARHGVRGPAHTVTYAMTLKRREDNDAAAIPANGRQPPCASSPHHPAAFDGFRQTLLPDPDHVQRRIGSP